MRGSIAFAFLCLVLMLYFMIADIGSKIEVRRLSKRLEESNFNLAVVQEKLVTCETIREN